MQILQLLHSNIFQDILALSSYIDRNKKSNFFPQLHPPQLQIQTEYNISEELFYKDDIFYDVIG